MARMGMDVEAVEGASKQLKNKADEIQRLTAEIDRIVNNLTSIWDGQDAKKFVTEWWPGHKKSLKSIEGSIRGLGQSAYNNASEQRTVSGR